MIYIKELTNSDLRLSGGSSTTISKTISLGNFFPPPKVPPNSDTLKFYHGQTSTNVEYGHDGVAKREIRIKNFALVINAEGAAIGARWRIRAR